MQLSCILLLFFCLQASAATYAQQMTIQGENIPLKTVFKEIRKQTGYNFIFSDKTLKRTKPVTVHEKNAALDVILEKVFKGQPITYSLESKLIIVSPKKEEKKDEKVREQFEVQLQKQVSGKVVDSITGEPLVGVTIRVQGSTAGAVTDGDGKFTIDVDDDAVLEVSFVGYITQSISVSGRSSIEVSLSSTSTGLDQLVVVGYGTQKKSDLTGAISSISNVEYENQPVTNLSQVMQGRASGVEVSDNSGAPGGETKIRIRGANSILGSNDPLYVIDGYVGGDISNIDPSTIETLQILKDASATAIYGSRGANGVVIITTKMGQKNSFHISYSGKAIFSKEIGREHVLSPLEYAETVNQRDEDLGLTKHYSEEQIQDFKNGAGTNWQDEIYKKAFGHEHNLQISGGSEKTNYFVSGDYLKQDGVIEESAFKKYNLKANFTSNITNKLSLSIKTDIISRKNSNTQLQSGSANPIAQAVSWAPTTPKRQEDGSFTILDPIGSFQVSPLILIHGRSNIIQVNEQNINLSANYRNLVEGLDFQTMFVVNNLNSFSRNFVSPEADLSHISSASESFLGGKTIQQTNTLTYRHLFNNGHDLQLTGVVETQHYSQKNFDGSASSLLIPDLAYNNLSLAGNREADSDVSSWSLFSLIGRFNYNFREKYYITGTIRQDASSRFRKDKRKSLFPSLALSWDLTKEDFFEPIIDNTFINRVKLRASWGKSGSQAIAPFATRSTYSTTTYSFDNNSVTSVLQLGNPGNPDLKWETTEQRDIGVEFGIIEGRINIDIDYFSKSTFNLLLDRPVPGYAGGGTITVNAGSTINRGWDISVGGEVVHFTDGVWVSNVNFSSLRNRVTNLGGITNDGRLLIGTNSGAGLSTQPEFIVQEGKSLGAFYGLNYLGTWKPHEATEASEFGNLPGDSRYEDINGDKAINGDDFQIIGFGMPKYTLGWNNTFSYKKFTLNFFFQGLLGLDKMNYSQAAINVGSGDVRQFNSPDQLVRYIPGVNETSDIPAFSNSNKNFTQSSRFIENGDFVRLKNLSLSYDLSLFNKSIEQGLDCQVYVAASNLLTVTKYSGPDPESTNNSSSSDINQNIDYGSYPNVKALTLGVKINF